MSGSVNSNNPLILPARLLGPPYCYSVQITTGSSRSVPSVTDLTVGNGAVQLDLFTDEKLREKWEKIDKTVDWLRGRFGNNCVQRAVVLQDKSIAGIDAKAEHIIHPVGYF